LSTRSLEFHLILKIDSLCECESFAEFSDGTAEKSDYWREPDQALSTESGGVGRHSADKGSIVEI
jgi:hypothetical protein